ncbi:MAG TPA: PEP-CTERM sorting domain-containing protein [Candidatus Limnocylindrales bacterium]|nr:PEP-CTERM sorting domain-containing protein [Candidatus Limnocylindrales bacterium]
MPASVRGVVFDMRPAKGKAAIFSSRRACGLGLFAGPLVLLAMVCFAASPARASLATVNLSNITFNGTSACSSSPCEIFNISFEWNTSTNQLAAGSMSFQSQGAFGNFSFEGAYQWGTGTAFFWADPQGVVLAFVSPCGASQFPSGCTFNIDQAFVTCVTQACATDFGVSWSNPFVTANSGAISGGDPTSVPEPSIYILLVCGLLSLVLFHRRSNREWQRTART